MTSTTTTTTRLRILDVTCPSCGARAGEPCVGMEIPTPRRDPHPTRRARREATQSRQAYMRSRCDDLLMRRVRTAHVIPADADQGRVVEVLDAARGTVLVAWDQGIRTPCSVQALVAD